MKYSSGEETYCVQSVFLPVSLHHLCSFSQWKHLKFTSRLSYCITKKENGCYVPSAFRYLVETAGLGEDNDSSS